MNNFKNLPSDVLNNIFEYYNPYKTAFTNNIIKKNVLHNAVKRRYIKNIKDDCIKCLYNFIFDLNLYAMYNYMDISKITYKSYNFYYHIYYNNNILFKVCIPNKNFKNIKNQNFYFFNKSYNHYLIYKGYCIGKGSHNCYCSNDYQHRGYHKKGVSYEEFEGGDESEEEEEEEEEEELEEVEEEDEEDDDVIIVRQVEDVGIYTPRIKDYFEDYGFIVDLYPFTCEEDKYTRNRFLQWVDRCL